MIFKFENESMTNFIFLKAVDIESKDPYIANEQGYTPPCWKISSEWFTSVLNVQILELYDVD
mgnify:CR=1 FL=1